MHHLETNNILVETQFGFRANHSYELQLLFTVDNLATAINKRLQVRRLLYTEFFQSI